EVHFDQLLSAVLADYLSPLWLAILVGTGPSAAATGSDLDAAHALAPGTTRSHTGAGSSVHNAPAGARITAKARVQTHYAFVKDERCCGDSHSTETLPCRISDHEIPNALLGHR